MQHNPIARHLQLAKSLQGSYAVIQNKIRVSRVVESMDFSGLSPLEFSLLLHRMAQVAAISADLERQTLRISDPETKIKIDATVTGEIDFTKLTDEELRQLARN